MFLSVQYVYRPVECMYGPVHTMYIHECEPKQYAQCAYWDVFQVILDI